MPVNFFSNGKCYKKQKQTNDTERTVRPRPTKKGTTNKDISSRLTVANSLITTTDT